MYQLSGPVYISNLDGTHKYVPITKALCPLDASTEGGLGENLK